VIAPFLPPKQEDGIVWGRGACDDKAGVVAILGALRALDHQRRATGQQPARSLLVMFVIEEEPGGNGSLSLAIDRELKTLYDTLVVLECTGNRIHPANRGAVWYQARLAADVPLLEMAAFVIGELEDEGRAIKAESRHPLFPQRPVQTCHGVFGPFGEHPSRICGEAAFAIRFDAPPPARAMRVVQDCLEAGLAEYLGRYGDKTKVLDRATARPKVARHYDLRPDGAAVVVAVHGAAGHMGSIDENDGAITKLATLVRALVRSKAALARQAGGSVRLELVGHSEPTLCLEGGQGFVPTHGMDEITARLRRAAERGAEAYLAWTGRPGAGAGAGCVQMSYDKLHNAAFDGDPDSPAMRRALAAARECGRPQPEVVGWTVSCDARLFALEYPGLPVLTVGPGQVEHAHSDHEHVRVEEMAQAAQWIAAYLLGD
jgi:acetylornithine deacetylase/succinyl-diaminopimelate desuccinylase-like protein